MGSSARTVCWNRTSFWTEESFHTRTLPPSDHNEHISNMWMHHVNPSIG